MKSSTLKKMINLAVLAATMLVATAGFAQKSENQYRASIPFQFQIAGKVLPAGDYIVKLTDHFVQIRPVDSTNGAGIATLRSERKHAAQQDALEFTVYGNQYFLTHLWFEGSELGRSVVVSKAELEIAQQAREGQVVLAMKK